MNSFAPLILDLSGRDGLVVGGGKVAERKIKQLLKAGMHVVVVSPIVTEQIERWVKENQINWIRQLYTSDLLEGKEWVVAATNDKMINEQICTEAKRRGQWVNAVDELENSNFIFPSVLNRGKLMIAVSTSGASPHTAKQITRQLAFEYGQEYEVLLDFFAEIRLKVRQLVDDTNKRQQFYARFAETDWLQSIRTGQFEQLCETWYKEVERLAGK